MLLSSLIRAAEETHSAEPAMSPLLIGGLSLGILLVLLVALLAFGKGRVHS